MQHEWLRHKDDAAGALRQWALRVGAVAACVALLAMSAPIIWAPLAVGIGLAGLLALAGTLVFQALPSAMQRLGSPFRQWTRSSPTRPSPRRA